ncbi:AAA family ATPase [Pistricoccus aurantiacus]|uniref:AAA family ATPase n=1 Tax=Pistricoccus aurantiacus TaxID=1883414 RepID=A0A5B8SZK3_9GAMM|nr:AAA family ATPase [Pistricoccus aurantiacus]QEA40935.1 AAA family ATPase [Pistricoccus aurantiacus]
MRNVSATERLALLGHFSLTLGEDAVTQFSYDKVKALLVYLLLHEQPVNRATLAELLWPDQGLSSGRTNLRHALHCLRQSLGNDADRVLVVSRQTIAFRRPDPWGFDLHELQTLLETPADIATLESILELYRGDLVEELQLPSCAEFQRWLLRVRNEWRQRVIAFAETVLAKQDKVPESLLRILVSRFSGYGPFHERLVKQLAEQGQSAAAHEQYSAYLQLLALSGQQPEPSFLQLARYWSDTQADMHLLSSQSAFARSGSQDGHALQEEEIEQRQLSVMAIRLSLECERQNHDEIRHCLNLQFELLRWLEQQCHHLGGFWLPGATGGIGLACFGTHGPAHQLAELVALYEHCRRTLAEESARRWNGEGESPVFRLAAGLNSGRVIYLPEHQLVDPLGDITQDALALMSAAEGSELVISQAASQHMPPALDLEPRLSPRLIASDGRIRHRALVLGINESSRDALPPTLFGRESALRKLRDALARASIGLRQSILVRAPSGMGKSALLVAFRQMEQSRDTAICWQPVTRLAAQIPYSMTRSLLRWYLERELDANAFDDLLRRHPNLIENAEEADSLRMALGFDTPSSDAPALKSTELDTQVTRLTQRLIERLTAERVLVIMIDDIHWLDEPSFKVLVRLQAQLPINCNLLMIASHHGREALPSRLNWDQLITLERLDNLQASRLLTQLSRRYRLHLSPRLRAQLIERCDGVPLYLQEICRRLDVQRREGHSLQLDELPQGLLGLLAGRIDQLDNDREAAHIAAILGRQFRFDFLRECSAWEEERLKRAMEHMLRLEIIQPCHENSDCDYQFSHQLLQEAAYLSCPRAMRIRIHHQVVELIEKRFPVWISRHPGEFATHLRRSGDYARGARYFELAARESLKVSANRTALKMADAGLASLRLVESRFEREISLLTVRGQAAFALEGHGSPLAQESFIRARELLMDQARRKGQDEIDVEQRFLVKWGLWVGCIQRHSHADAFALSAQLASLAAKFSDPRYQRLAQYAQACCEYWAGRLPQARDHLQELDPLNQPMMIEWLPFSDHPQVSAVCYHSWALCLSGDYRQAEQQAEAAIRLAERIDHPGTLAMALMFSAALYRQLGHVYLAGQRGQRVFEISQSPDLHLWQMSAQGVLGWQRALNGERDGLTLIEDSMQEFGELTGRDRYQRPLLYFLDACLALDELERGEDYLSRCLLIAQERRSLFLPELAIQLARVRFRLGYAEEEIRTLALQARELAQEHGNRHQQLNVMELWLTLIDPEDSEVRESFRKLLGEVSHGDAPVLIRWHALRDQLQPYPANVDS